MDNNSDEESDSSNYTARLNQEWVQVLINLRMKYSKSFTGKRNAAVQAWNSILSELQELGAPKSLTLPKIKKKWMNLISRYKQIKFGLDSARAVSTTMWVYYEQLDRAYTKNPNIVEIRKSRKYSESDESLDGNGENAERQKFVRSLIELRYNYRHLFTGKKYAAQKGWLVIQKLLPSGNQLSTDQISKRWQNLVQRYKSLLETNANHKDISWIYFEQLHKIMTSGKPESNELELCEVTVPSETEEVRCNEGEVSSDVGKQDVVVEEQQLDSTTSVRKRKRKASMSTDELLTYMRERDCKHDAQFAELLGIMKIILKCLEK